MRIDLYKLGIVAILTWIGISVRAHEGHEHAPTPGETTQMSGPIVLAPEAVANLGIQSVEANLVPMQKSIEMPALIEPLPEKNVKITARFEGRVLELLTKLGEKVQAGQSLLKLDPIMIGNPPVTVRSTISGYVSKQNLTLGQAFTPETILMEIVNYEDVLARGITYESKDFNQIKVGQSARVKVDEFPDQIFKGTVQRVDVGLEPESRTFEIYVLLHNPELNLRPNTQATIAVGVGEEQTLLAIPQKALLGEIGNHFVFVRNGTTFEKRMVVLGIREGDRVEILEGVLPGEQVVIQGNYQLQYATSLPPAQKSTEEVVEKTKEKRFPKWTLFAGGLFFIILLLLLFGRRGVKR
jgi:membrane fusion protein, heavy metal efflux system